MAFIRCALLFLAGAALQLLAGDPDKSFLCHPWGIIMAVNYLYVLILTYYCSGKRRWIRNLFDHYSMTASLACMTIVCVIFGLYKVDFAWPFLLVFLYFISVLGLRCIDDIVHWKTRRFLPSVIHVAVFITMAAGIFSSGDKLRLRIVAPIGYPVEVGMTEDGKSHTLPFSITLKQFTIDEYPPKIYLMNPQSGTLSKEYITVDSEESVLGNWTIRILNNLESAGRMSDSDAYVAMEHVGTAPAAYVQATNENGEVVAGWVSCGSHIFSASTLEMDRNNVLFMANPEAAAYISDIMIQDKDGEEIQEVRVNHPARKGPWKIYQVSYDRERGKWSTTSVLECIRDGWYPLIRTALWLILGAGVAMAFSAGMKRKRKEDRS